MLQPGDRVVAGISGGADSVCLLFLLLAYAKKVPITLAVVHINHGIRSEAGEDASFVENLCRRLEIPFYLRKVDVRALAAKQKCSEEDAGRRARYEAFSQVAEELSANKIAVAHNANDCSETMLFHLFRGTGVRGLAGILPVRGNIIRPLLCLERKEIEAYLQKRGISFCLDGTNEKDDYTRNRIRHHILPYAEREIVSGCVSHMTQTAAMMSVVEDYLSRQTNEAMESCVHREYTQTAEACNQANHSMQESTGDQLWQIRIDLDSFCGLHSVIQDRIILQSLKELTPHQKDISAVHVRLIMDLCEGDSGRRASLPFGIVGIREYKELILSRQDPNAMAKLPEKTISLALLQGGSYVLSLDEQSRLVLSVLPYKKFEDVPQNQYTKWFDYDKIKKSLELRGRKQGDFLIIRNGADGISHKTLKQYMITEKIPLKQRDRIWVLAEENHILWLIGYRISEYYKITDDTTRILQVQFITKR